MFNEGNNDNATDYGEEKRIFGLLIITGDRNNLVIPFLHRFYISLKHSTIMLWNHKRICLVNRNEIMCQCMRPVAYAFLCVLFVLF